MLGGEMMIMSPTRFQPVHPERCGPVIWNAADGRTSLDEIVESGFVTKFEVTPEVARHDAEFR